MKTRLQPLALAVLAAVPGVVSAANVTWDANPALPGAQDGPGIWDTTSPNWWTGSANTLFNAGAPVPDSPFFGSASGQAGVVTLGSSVVASNVFFNPPGAGAYTIAGGGFTLGLTNRHIVANVDAAITADIAGGPVIIAHSWANTPGGLLRLSGNNTFTGLTIGPNDAIINGGAPNTTAAIRALSNQALGAGVVNFNSQGNITSPRLELAGGLSITNLFNFQGRNNPTMAFVALGAGTTLGGNITGAAGGQHYGFQSEAAGGLTLSGVLALNTTGTRNFVFAGSGGGAVSGPITGGAAAIAIVKSGSGAWTLSGANTFTGHATVGDGTLHLDYSTQNNSKLPDGARLKLAGGALNLAGGSHTEAVGSTIVAPGHSAVTRSSGAATVNLGPITRARGGVVDFGAAGVASTTTPNIHGILGGYATVGGADWAVGAGGVSAYAGYTDIAATGGILADGAASNVRLNSPGGGGVIALGAPVTTVNTIVQNTTTAATVDTTSGTLRLGAAGGVLIPPGRQSLTIGASPGSGTLTAGGADNMPGEVILINNSASPLTVNAVVTDNGAGPVSLTKAGSGSATLAGANTHSGVTTIAGGMLNISADNNLGAAPPAPATNIVLSGGTLNATASFTLDANRGLFLGALNANAYNGGTISVASGRTLDYGGVISGGIINASGGFLTNVSPGSLTKTGPGTLALSGVNTYAGGTRILGGTLSVIAAANLGGAPGCHTPDNLVIDGGTLELNGAITLAANRGVLLGPAGGSGAGTFAVTAGNTAIVNGQISDNWNGSGSLVKTGDGVLELGAAVNNYSGNTIVSAGTLRLNHSRAIPAGPGKGGIVLNGVLDLNATAAGLNGLTGSGIVDNLNGSPASLTIGHNDTTSTFNGSFQAGGGPLTLNKTGSGVITLAGSLLHSGGTVVSAGALALSGAANPSSTTNVIVHAGATLNVSGLAGGLGLGFGQRLSGNGTVVGNVNDAGFTIAPGLGGAGTLTVNGNLVLGGGALEYDLRNAATAGGGVNDLTIVNGNLSLASPVTVNLNHLDGTPGLAPYTLFAYNTFSGDVANLAVPPGFTVSNNIAARTILLVPVHVPVTLTWRGDGFGNIWDSGGTANWMLGGASQVFMPGDTAVFDDTGSNTPPVTVAGSISPGAVIVNAAQDYTFTGAGIPAGLLLKTNAGALILENDNTPAATIIAGGAVVLGNGGLSGSLGAGPVTNNAVLRFNRADTLAVSSPVTGAGALEQAGAGIVQLAASNSFTGPVTVHAGILSPRNDFALGTADAGVTVADGAQLYLDLNYNIAGEPLTLAGAGVGGSGAFRKGGAGSSIWGGPLTLAAGARINLDGNATLLLTNAAGISGANVNLELAGDGGSSGVVSGPLALGSGALTKSGAGNWTLQSPTNDFTGKTTINAGALFITGPAGLGHVGGVTPDFITLNGGSLGAATNITLNDGLRGITAIGFNAAAGFNVAAGVTLTLSNAITGSGTVAKAGPGTLALVSAQPHFTGVLNIDTFSTFANDGAVLLTTAAAVAGVPSPILVRNNNMGSSTLALDGSAAPITIGQTLQVNCRNNDVPWIHSLAGANTLAGGVNVEVGGNRLLFQSDAGALVQNGDIIYVGALPGARTYMFTGAGDHIVAGVIHNSANGAPISLTMAGTGTLTLAANNTYGAGTTVSNGTLMLTGGINQTGLVAVVGGTLRGTGAIVAPVIVTNAGTLAAGGAAAIGSLAITGDVALAGNTLVRVNKTSGARDQFTGINNLSYGGTLTVTNLDGAFAAGDSFQIFSAAAPAGNFAAIVGSPGPGLAWHFNPAAGVLSVVSGMAATPTNITYTVSANQMTITWPASHLGWILQSQTNTLAVGLGANWVDVPGSASVTNLSLPIHPGSPAVFYRLRRP